MDKLLTVHKKKPATKHTKTKEKPIKVVYISNPMKINTSASEFMALVQELTGRDSVLPDSGKYSEIIDGVEPSHQMVAADHGIKVKDDQAQEEPGIVLELDRDRDRDSEVPKRPDDLAFEPYDDVFMPQILENFDGFSPSNLLYESPHVDVLTSLDAL